MSWEVDEACELKVGGRWLKTTVHELDVAGHPRVRNPTTGKLVRTGPGKIRRPSAAVVVRRTAGVEDDAPELAPAAEIRPAYACAAVELVPQPKPVTHRSPAFLEHLRRRPCDHCGAPPRSDPAHFGPHGMGLKASDFSAASLCRDDHEHWHMHGCLPGLDHERSLEVYVRGSCNALLSFLLFEVAHEVLAEAAAQGRGRRRT